ncbi:MAG: SapC family protein [Betaproteobacteria bacterium]|nr:SapC family protein [Betaproteobacteria bacterium]
MAKSTREKKPKKPKAASSVKAKIKPQVKSKAAGGPNENPAPEISVESPQPAAKYPLFYNNVTTLTAEQHSALKFRTKRDFTFAKNANAVPVTIGEFPLLSRFYPIAFTAGEKASCLAILGVPSQTNLFVSETGAWRDNCYIPAYVRRYPFMLAGTDDPTKMILCADTEATSLSEDGDELLFEEQKPTKLLDDKLAFSRALYDQFKVTNEFTTALSEQDLLVEQSVKLTTTDGQETGASGFCIIDETKFNQLPDDVFLDWRRRGWLPAIYLQLLSMNNWASLVAH